MNIKALWKCDITIIIWRVWRIEEEESKERKEVISKFGRGINSTKEDHVLRSLSDKRERDTSGQKLSTMDTWNVINVENWI